MAATAVVYALLTISAALSAPISRDEHMYAAAAVTSADHALYRDVVFTHPPVSAWWYRSAIGLWPEGQILLPMRLAQALVFLMLGAVWFGIFRRVGASSIVAAFLVLLLLNLDEFRQSMGLARSHELALLLALTPWLLLPLDPGDERQRWRLLTAGLLAGLVVATRITHLPLAMLVVAWPALATAVTRSGWRDMLWTTLGATIGLGVVAWFMRGAHGAVLTFSFWDYHLLNLRFHELHGFGQGLTLVERLEDLRRYCRHTDLAIWSVLVVTALVACRGWVRPWSQARWWLALGVWGCGAVMMLVTRPAQIGYEEPWLVGGAMLVAVATARLVGRPRQVLLVALALGVAVGFVHQADGTVRALRHAAHPSRWPAVVIHAAGQRLDAALGGRPGYVLTTHPLYALEAGRPIDPTLATGEFVWRLNDLVADRVIGGRRLTTPDSLGERMATQVPAAVVAVAAAPWDAPLLAQARALAWRMQPLAGGVAMWTPPRVSGHFDQK